MPNEDITARFQKAKEDREEFDRLVEENLGLVRSIAKRFLSRGAEYEDIVQIGSIGLIRAIRAFEPERGLMFSTYAVPVITGEIKRFFRDDGIVKIGRDVKRNAGIINKFCEEYSARFSREASIEDIIQGVGLNKEDVILALSAANPTRSLDEVTPEGRTLKDVIPDTDKNFDKFLLKDAVSSLRGKDRKIIELRYFKDLSQSQVGEILGLSQATVSRDEKRILSELRELYK